MHEEITKQYGNRVRLRACGIYWNNDKILVINHFNLYNHDFWAPPGGGIEFGETAAQTVQREMQEEAGIEVGTKEFLFATEIIKHPLHAVELFFAVGGKSNEIRLGTNPETKHQIMTEIAFKSVEELAALEPHKRHGIFNEAPTTEKFKSLSGYFKI